jgi:hypothetical protein
MASYTSCRCTEISIGAAIAANIDDGDDDIIADDYALIAVSGQDQHRLRLLPPASEARDRP